jgi:hypothetical protein
MEERRRIERRETSDRRRNSSGPPSYREWLADAIQESGLSKREVARKLAAKHPNGVSLETIESYRRTIRKILFDGQTPRDPLRASIGEALDRDDYPTGADEDEDDLEATLAALTREHPQLARALTRLVRQ